jgi:hypothetical protein
MVGQIVRSKTDVLAQFDPRRQAAIENQNVMTTTIPSTLDWREFWRVHGTSCRSLFELHCAIVNRLQATSSLWVSS